MTKEVHPVFLENVEMTIETKQFLFCPSAFLGKQNIWSVFL